MLETELKKLTASINELVKRLDNGAVIPVPSQDETQDETQDQDVELETTNVEDEVVEAEETIRPETKKVSPDFDVKKAQNKLRNALKAKQSEDEKFSPPAFLKEHGFSRVPDVEDQSSFITMYEALGV